MRINENDALKIQRCKLGEFGNDLSLSFNSGSVLVINADECYQWKAWCVFGVDLVEEVY